MYLSLPPRGGGRALSLLPKTITRLSLSAVSSFILQSVFDFVDVSQRGAGLLPGSYTLVAQFPRRVFEEGADVTLAGADLAQKQEALFIEMK